MYACRGWNPGLALPISLLTSPAFEPLCGQQFFYGAAVAAAAAGPPPIPFADLSATNLAAVFTSLLSRTYRDGAQRLAVALELENGTAACLEHFHSSLPLSNMVCDLSTLLGERPSLGRYYYPRLGIKVSDEVPHSYSLTSYSFLLPYILLLPTPVHQGER